MKRLDKGFVALCFAIAAMAVVVAVALASRKDSPPRLSKISASGEVILLKISGVPSSSLRQGRYRAAGAGWKLVNLPRHSSRWRLADLDSGVRYEFQLRVCSSAKHCGAFSRALEVSTTGTPAAPETPPFGVGYISPPVPSSCPIFPKDNPINQEITKTPVNPHSANYIATIGLSTPLHAAFGSNPQYGIPYSVVGPKQPKVPIYFTAYGYESDRGPYPVPLNAPVEGDGLNGDRHLLVLQEGTCKLYEMFAAARRGEGWEAEGGVVFNLRSNALRPNGWTSADAAGLPIFPLLVRYEEVAAGRIDHALRISVAESQEGFIHPATHYSSNSRNPNLPPMGLRVRLKASFGLSGYHGQSLVILEALKRYGAYVADNGNNWYLFGAPDSRWNEQDLKQLETVPGSDFEALQTGPIRHTRG